MFVCCERDIWAKNVWHRIHLDIEAVLNKHKTWFCCRLRFAVARTLIVSIYIWLSLAHYICIIWVELLYSVKYDDDVRCRHCVRVCAWCDVVSSWIGWQSSSKLESSVKGFCCCCAIVWLLNYRSRLSKLYINLCKFTNIDSALGANEIPKTILNLV